MLLNKMKQFFLEKNIVQENKDLIAQRTKEVVSSENERRAIPKVAQGTYGVPIF